MNNIRVFIFLNLFFTGLKLFSVNPLDNLQLTIGYKGEWLSHPGFFLGIELIAMEDNSQQLFLSSDISWYLHSGNHSAITFQGEVGHRFYTTKTFYIESRAGLGYKYARLHSPNNVTIYERIDDTIVESPNHGYSYIQPVLSFGVGFDGDIRNSSDGKVFTRIALTGDYPYNNYILPRLFFLGGGILPIK